MKKNFWFLNILHILNDGYEASFLLLLPFIAKDFHLNLAQVGALGSTEGLVEVFLSIPAAYFAIKFGGIRVLLFALLTYSFGYLLTGFSPSFFILFITFFIAGIGFGFFHTIGFGLVARWSDKATRGKQIGNFTAIGDLGRIGISSLVTFVIAYLGWRKAAISYAIVGFIVLVVLFKLFSSIKGSIEKQKNETKDVPLHVFLKNKLFLLANAVNILDTFASSSLFIFLPFLLLKRGIQPATLGIFTATFFVGNFLGKSGLGRLVDKHGNAKIFIISELAMAACIFFLANTSSLIVIIITSVLLGVFTKGTIPVVKTMISESVEHHGNFEKSFGLNTIVASGAAALGPLLLGIISNKFGIIEAFNVSAVFALLAVIPATMFKLIGKPS